MLRQGMVFLPARQLLLILKSWFNDLVYFLFDTVRVPVFYLSKNRTENRFLVPVRAVNRVPVHKTNENQTFVSWLTTCIELFHWLNECKQFVTSSFKFP